MIFEILGLELVEIKKKIIKIRWVEGFLWYGKVFRPGVWSYTLFFKNPFYLISKTGKTLSDIAQILHGVKNCYKEQILFFILDTRLECFLKKWKNSSQKIFGSLKFSLKIFRPPSQKTKKN